MLRTLAGYLAAVLVAYVCAAALTTQWVMASLAEMDVPVDLSLRVHATTHDLVGLLPLYLPLIAAAMAVAFPVAALVLRWLPGWRSVGYPLAGGVALLALHLILHQTFDITPIAAARSALGLTAQAMCGVLGGWVFLQIRTPRE